MHYRSQATTNSNISTMNECMSLPINTSDALTSAHDPSTALHLNSQLKFTETR